MNKRTKIYLPLLLSFAVAIGIFIGTTFNYKKKTLTFFEGNAKEKKIKRLIDYIQYDYVDYVDTDSLLDGTIRDILSKLDPHSVYIPPKDHDKITETMNGKFVGIGIQFRMFKDSLTVVKVLDKGPSEKAGLLEGDRILIANNDTLYGKNLDSNIIISKLKGEPNTPVDVTVYRKSENKNIPFTIQRGDVPIESVDAFYMLNDSIGYIKVNKFSATTYDEFKLALDNLLDEGMQELVLDLRQNPGGFLQVATQIIDEFLEDDKLIVFTKDKRNKIDESFATAKGEFEKGGIYVLIDGGSASASEIVAGALQDNDKGTIIGRRSFGKGLVQQEMDLGDGSAIRLTVSRYYTPTGRSIQKPYDHNGNKDYYNDNERRFFDGELVNADSIKVNDSLKYITPKGKVVYGGGGIIPNIFVPLDTTLYLNRFHFRKINDFVFDYYDSHRVDFNDISFDEFDESFDNENKILNTYKKSITNDFHQIKNTTEQEKNLKTYLKALFAQQLFDTNSYFKVINRDDKMLEKVMEIEKYGLPISQ